jgi:hypothetical protein
MKSVYIDLWKCIQTTDICLSSSRDIVVLYWNRIRENCLFSQMRKNAVYKSDLFVYGSTHLTIIHFTIIICNIFLERRSDKVTYPIELQFIRYNSTILIACNFCLKDSSWILNIQMSYTSLLVPLITSRVGWILSLNLLHELNKIILCEPLHEYNIFFITYLNLER